MEYIWPDLFGGHKRWPATCLQAGDGRSALTAPTGQGPLRCGQREQAGVRNGDTPRSKAFPTVEYCFQDPKMEAWLWNVMQKSEQKDRLSTHAKNKNLYYSERKEDNKYIQDVIQVIVQTK